MHEAHCPHSAPRFPGQPAVHKWDMGYLETHMTGADVTVFRSTGDFLYHDGDAGQADYDWSPPTERLSMPVHEFAAELRRNVAQEGRELFSPNPGPVAGTCVGGVAARSKGGRGGGEPDQEPPSPAPAASSPAASMLAALSAQEGSAPSEPAASGGGGGVPGSTPPAVPPSGGARSRVYMQHSLSEAVSSTMKTDFTEFNWPLATALAKRNAWGPLTSNLLLVGERCCVTPLHYDEQHNLFAQVRGRKLAILSPPDCFDCFYPYPVGHPHDRQAQVNVRLPDRARFPEFSKARFLHAVLKPGEVLYIPSYWWHEIHSPFEDTVSVNFWFRAGPPGTPALPLRDPVHRVALRRNIEKFMGQSYGFPASTRFFQRLGAGDLTVGTSSQSDRNMVSAVLKLLTVVLAADELEPFLMALCRVRFDLPRKAPGGLLAFPPKTPLVRAAIAEAVAAAMRARQAAATGSDAGGGEGSAAQTPAQVEAGAPSLTGAAQAGHGWQARGTSEPTAPAASGGSAQQLRGQT